MTPNFTRIADKPPKLEYIWCPKEFRRRCTLVCETFQCAGHCDEYRKHKEATHETDPS
jgi:hypothetical protein